MSETPKRGFNVQAANDGGYVVFDQNHTSYAGGVTFAGTLAECLAYVQMKLETGAALKCTCAAGVVK